MSAMGEVMTRKWPGARGMADRRLFLDTHPAVGYDPPLLSCLSRIIMFLDACHPNDDAHHIHSMLAILNLQTVPGLRALPTTCS